MSADPRYECPECGKPYTAYEEDFRGQRGICTEHGDFWIPEYREVVE